MIQLYYSPGSANLVPHMLLEEIGVPFELVLVDRANCAHKRPECSKELRLDREAVERWMTNGAQPSDTVAALIKRAAADTAADGAAVATAAAPAAGKGASKQS